MRTNVAIFLILLSTSARADDTTIGFVKTLSGHATLNRANITQQVELAMPVHAQDRLETGADGRLGVTFRDNTRISLGPDSRVDAPSFRLSIREPALWLRRSPHLRHAAISVGADGKARARCDVNRNADGNDRRTRYAFLVRAEK